MGYSAGGVRIEDRRPHEFWARIIGESGSGASSGGDGSPVAYAWTQVIPQQDQDGFFIDYTDGGRDSADGALPAYEVNNNSLVPDSTIVRMYLADRGDYYYFFFKSDADCPACPDPPACLGCDDLPRWPYIPETAEGCASLVASFTSETGNLCVATANAMTFNGDCSVAPEYTVDFVNDSVDATCDTFFNSTLGTFKLRPGTPGAVDSACGINNILEIEFTGTNGHVVDLYAGAYITAFSLSPFAVTIYFPFLGTIDITE